MSIKTVKINRWDGGVVNDGRSKRSNVAKIITNAEVLKNPNKITPFRDSEDGNSNATADHMRNWCIGLGASSTYKLYGLARADGSDVVRILTKELSTGASTDLHDNSWNETANNDGTTAGVTDDTKGSSNLFIYYARTGYIYGAHGGTAIWRYDPDGTDAFVDSHIALTYSFIGQGLVHSKDDILYIPYFNAGGFILSKNGTATANTTALTLPKHYQPHSICEWGNFLAIGCANINTSGNSIVYLWDRDSSLATLSENYDLGYGTLVMLENISGHLVAVMSVGGNTGDFPVNGVIKYQHEVHFKILTPSGFETVLILQNTETGTQTTLLPIYKQKINERLHFMMSIGLHGARREGVWSFGKNELGQWTLIHERTPDNDTLTGNTGTGKGALRGFFYVGDYLFQAFVNSSGNHEVTKTNDTASYTATTIFESTINPNMPEEDLYKKKQLKAVVVRYVALPSAGQVVLKQRTDSTTAWASVTAAYTETTDNALVTEIVANGSTQFTAGRELEFRLESTGGAEILELVYQYETLETLIDG